MTKDEIVKLAEQCGAECGRYEGEVVWIKFHQPSIEPFAAALAQPVAWTEAQTMHAIQFAAAFGTVKLTSEYGPYDIDRPTFKCDRFVEAIIAARDAQWSAVRGGEHG